MQEVSQRQREEEKRPVQRPHTGAMLNGFDQDEKAGQVGRAPGHNTLPQGPQW